MKKYGPRSKKNKKSVWLITYADMTTLLLTFFVLIFSMSSMDSSIISRINLVQGAAIVDLPQGGWEAMRRANAVEKILKEKGRTTYNLEEIKEMLFPKGKWPLDIPPSMIDEHLQLMQAEEGIVISLSDGLIFDPGAYELNEAAMSLLKNLSPLVKNLSMDINLCGFAEEKEKAALQELGRKEGQNFDLQDLAVLRAMAVLKIFLDEGSAAERFSLSGYLGSQSGSFNARSPREDLEPVGVSSAPKPEPLDSSADFESEADFSRELGADKGRRVEILIKVNRRLADYA